MPLISAHRGGSLVEGERAAERYRRAIELGVDYVEFDVRRSPAGDCVICHDPDLAAQLRSEVMTLAELLDLTRGRVGLHLDLKEGGYEALVVDTVLEACPAGRLVITGADAVVRAVKDRYPHVLAGLSLGEELTGAPPWVKARVRMSELFPKRRLERSGADFVAVHRQLAQLNVLRYCASVGIPAWVWTVDEEPEMARFLADPRVATLITDRPEVALRLLRSG